MFAALVHLRPFDQASLLIVPSKEQHKPMLQKQPNQLGIQFAQHAPGIGCAPFINTPVVFSQRVEHLHLPSFPQEYESFLRAESLGRGRGRAGWSKPPVPRLSAALEAAAA
jgi:hypothetical protein